MRPPVPPFTAETAAHDRTWTYGHVVVDEAQELSPMQWRLLARRCPMKSFTIVGDIAQSSRRDAAGSWASVLAPEFGDRWRLEELTVNYRSPARVQWSPTGNNIPDYPKLAQLWWQNIGDASSGAKTPQAAMDSLAAAQDVLQRQLNGQPESLRLRRQVRAVDAALGLA